VMIPYTYYKSGDLKKAEKHYKKFKKDYPESDRLEWVDKQLEKIKEERKKK
jgi:outer membrane protein assembly factor BamD (BamD/ComL family)